MIDENRAQEILSDLEDLLHNGNYPWDSEMADYWMKRNKELENGGYYLNISLKVYKLEEEK